MDNIPTLGKQLADNINSLIEKKINENYTKLYHQQNVFEGGLYGGARSLTDVSTSEEESYGRVGIKSGIVGA